jgi:hypothetical protein
MFQATKAGLVYFLIVFAAGFVIGPVRILVLEPRLGPVGALLIELPIMIAVMVLAARWALARFRVPARWNAWLTMGALALALQQIGDIAVAIMLRGMTMMDHWRHFTTAEGMMFAASLIIFLLMPGLVGRRNLTPPAAPEQ